MTGLRDERAAGECRRSKRLELSRPDAAAAAPHVTVAPPTLPRTEAPVPPPRTAYALRNRHVPVTSDRKPYSPARNEKREELKHDRPCSSRKKIKQHEPWEAPSCARVGLEHYNSMNQGNEHELVKAVDVNSFIWGGGWLHANFLARRKGAGNCGDLVPKYFFAELKLDAFGLHCTSCVKMDSVESKNLGDCGHCGEEIKHPAAGGYFGAASGDQDTSLFDLQLYNKQLELLASEKEMDGELDGW